MYFDFDVQLIVSLFQCVLLRHLRIEMRTKCAQVCELHHPDADAWFFMVSFLVHNAPLWHTMTYYDILWHTMTYYDILWHTILYYYVLLYIYYFILLLTIIYYYMLVCTSIYYHIRLCIEISHCMPLYRVTNSFSRLYYSTILLYV